MLIKMRMLLLMKMLMLGVVIAPLGVEFEDNNGKEGRAIEDMAAMKTTLSTPAFAHLALDRISHPTAPQSNTWAAPCG